MSVHTQGSQLFMKTPDNELLEVGGILDPELGKPKRKKINVTTLNETEMEQEEDGLYEPAESSFSIILNPKDPSHKKLIALSEDKSVQNIEYYLCCGNDTTHGATYGAEEVPTIDSGTGDVALPKHRHVAVTTGGAINVSIDIKSNDVIKVPVSFQQKKPWEMNWAEV